MQETFEKLRSLQEILSRKFEIENEITDIPKSLSTKKELLIRMKQSFIDKNEEYTTSKKTLSRLRLEISEAVALREKYEHQVSQISTQREYEALEKQIKQTDEREREVRKEIQRVEVQIEEMSVSIEREEQMIEEQNEELEDEQKKISEEIEDRKKSLTKLKQEENTIIPGMDEDVLFKFERIIRNKSGLGIVPIKGSICTGCHMILPGQYVNDVRAGEKILFCPYCSRILFYKEQQEIQEDELVPSDMGGLADFVDGFEE